MIGEMYTPVLYRDAISSGMPMFELDPTMMGMGSMYGGMGMYGGAYNTNYLGDVRLKPNLSRDTVNIINKKDSEAKKGMNTFFKVALGIAAFAVARTFFKGGFKSKPKIGGGSSWYKPWTWFKK